MQSNARFFDYKSIHPAAPKFSCYSQISCGGPSRFLSFAGCTIRFCDEVIFWASPFWPLSLTAPAPHRQTDRQTRPDQTRLSSLYITAAKGSEWWGSEWVIRAGGCINFSGAGSTSGAVLCARPARTGHWRRMTAARWHSSRTWNWSSRMSSLMHLRNHTQKH